MFNDVINNLNNTSSVNIRKQKLKQLYQVILSNETIIAEAIKRDLGKSNTESYMTEIGLVLKKLRHLTKRLNRLTKPKRIKTPLEHFPAKSYVYKKPYGKVLVMSPWNYPFLLAMEPVIGAYSAGNSVLLKTSEYAFNTSEVIKKIIELVFTKEEVVVIYGGYEENQALLNANFDYIFFTGSERVGRIVYEKAASKLIPVTLELGGKSPVIVDGTYPFALTARRILFGKILNAGQTCVAPDYVLVKKDAKELLIKALIDEAKKTYPNLLTNSDYAHIINEHHFKRVTNLIEPSDILYGGKSDLNSLKVDLTILDSTFESKVMQEEIFGPLLPILTYEDDKDLVSIINSRKTPLAMYVFSSNKYLINHLLDNVGYGDALINDVLIHVATNLPFGGFKESGMGHYHGDDTFNTFCHVSGVLKRGKIDLNVRYQPYTKSKEKSIKKLLH